MVKGILKSQLLELKYILLSNLKRIILFLFLILFYFGFVFYQYLGGEHTSFNYPKFMILTGFLNERIIFSPWVLALPLFSLFLGVDAFARKSKIPSFEYLFILPYSRIRAILIRFFSGIIQIVLLMMPLFLIAIFLFVASKTFNGTGLTLRLFAIFVSLLTFFSFTFLASLVLESVVTSSLIGIFLLILSIYSVQNPDGFLNAYSPLYILLNQDYLFTHIFPLDQTILWLLISIFVIFLSYGYFRTKDI